jgi:hypothetical protein
MVAVSSVARLLGYESLAEAQRAAESSPKIAVQILRLLGPESKQRGQRMNARRRREMRRKVHFDDLDATVRSASVDSPMPVRSRRVRWPDRVSQSPADGVVSTFLLVAGPTREGQPWGPVRIESRQ